MAMNLGADIDRAIEANRPLLDDERISFNRAYNDILNDWPFALDLGELVEIYRLTKECSSCRCYGSGTFARKVAGTDRHGNQNLVIEVCFGCEGKGYQTPRDSRRNYGYWAFYAKVSA